VRDQPRNSRGSDYIGELLLGSPLDLVEPRGSAGDVLAELHRPALPRRHLREGTPACFTAPLVTPTVLLAGVQLEEHNGRVQS